MCCTRLAVNTSKKSPSRHHHATLSGHIFATKARIDNGEKTCYLLNNNTSSTCHHNTVNFGLLQAEICWRVWGTSANFNGFRVLAALLHGTLLVGVSQILRRWTEGATYIRPGGHHVWHWPTFLVTVFFSGCSLFRDCAALCRWRQWKQVFTGLTTFLSPHHQGQTTERYSYQHSKTWIMHTNWPHWPTTTDYLQVILL